MQVNVVYSIGVRCYTEIILKRLQLVKFSSIFGNLNIRNYENVIKCIDTNFDILLNPNNVVFTKNIPAMEVENKIYGYRTLHKLFDNIYDYHSSTIAHHDLNNPLHIKHFERGIQRFNHIKDNHIPILFVNISIEYEFNNTGDVSNVIESLKKYGFKNIKIISIYKTSKKMVEPTLLHMDDDHISYEMYSYGYDDIRDDVVIKNILLTHFKFDHLLSITDFNI
jgi:hypothetical protein